MPATTQVNVDVKSIDAFLRNDDLSSIAFDHIKDNYWWGKYGDFRVIVRKPDGYINVTKLCALAQTASGKYKRFGHWMDNQKNHIFLQEISKVSGVPDASLLAEVRDGADNNDINGTYAHPMLVPHIAAWASPAFAVRVSQIVNESLIRDATVKKDARIDELVQENREQFERMSAEIAKLMAYSKDTNDVLHDTRSELKETRGELQETRGELQETRHELNVKADLVLEQTSELDIIHSKVDVICEQALIERVPAPQASRVLHKFGLVRVGDQTYKVIRTQMRAYNTAFARIKALHPDATEVLTFDPCAHAINILIRLKERCLEQKRASGHAPARFRHNTVFIDEARSYTEEELIDAIREVYEERRINVDEIEVE